MNVVYKHDTKVLTLEDNFELQFSYNDEAGVRCSIQAETIEELVEYLNSDECKFKDCDKNVNAVFRSKNIFGNELMVSLSFDTIADLIKYCNNAIA